MRTSLIALTAALLLTGNVLAADKNGRFSVRGAGLLSCKIYTQERAKQSKAYLMMGGWLDGYITGLNQYEVDTYDGTSFESTELIAAIINDHCKTHPKDGLFAVTSSIMNSLKADRIRAGSPFVAVKIGTRQTHLYQETVRRLQKTLKKKGYYKGKISGKWNSKTQQALKTFQKKSKLQASGFPDQITLWRLLRENS